MRRRQPSRAKRPPFPRPRKLDLEPVHRTGYLVNTVSYDIRRGDMEKLRSIPGVTNVTLAMKYEPELFSAKEMTDVYDA